MQYECIISINRKFIDKIPIHHGLQGCSMLFISLNTSTDNMFEKKYVFLSAHRLLTAPLLFFVNIFYWFINWIHHTILNKPQSLSLFRLQTIIISIPPLHLKMRTRNFKVNKLSLENCHTLYVRQLNVSHFHYLSCDVTDNTDNLKICTFQKIYSILKHSKK